MTKKIRNKAGSILILGVLFACFFIVPLIVVLTRLDRFVGEKTASQNTVEAACLLAANDVSRIMINDQNFGYVSLSNYPPTGKATCAPDGEPLPVTGINTLVGNIRQNTIVADELQNGYMRDLADADRICLENTIEELNLALSNSLSGNSKNAVDNQGEKVDPVKDVKAFLEKNLPAGAKVESIKLSNGWLSSGGGTTISVPKPESLGRLKPGSSQLGEYRPFVDVPVGNRSFTFGGVGRSASICKLSNFRQADKKHICSIVKIECTVSVNDQCTWLSPPGSTTRALKFASCCEPYSNPDIGPPGVMTLRFSGGSVPGLQSWSDFIAANAFHDNHVATYDVVGGDYPIDQTSRMRQSESAEQTTTSQQFAGHLYYWLRNGRLRPRIDGILSMVRETFPICPTAGFYVYEFEKDGTISRRTLERDPFPVGVTSDAQFSAVADTTTRNGSSAIIIFRNDVKHLGTAGGGKHGGQPIAGNPLNWCELQDFGGDEQLALLAGKGRLGTQLTIVDSDGSGSPLTVLNNWGSAIFKTFDGKGLSMQPRRTYYSGGLALDIEIGGTRIYDPNIDVISMRHLRLGRRI
jgi:hypothetical protein